MNARQARAGEGYVGIITGTPDEIKTLKLAFSVAEAMTTDWSIISSSVEARACFQEGGLKTSGVLEQARDPNAHEVSVQFRDAVASRVGLALVGAGACTDETILRGFCVDPDRQKQMLLLGQHLLNFRVVQLAAA